MTKAEVEKRLADAGIVAEVSECPGPFLPSACPGCGNEDEIPWSMVTATARAFCTLCRTDRPLTEVLRAM